VSAVADAVVKYDCPATESPPVVEALVNLPWVANKVPVVVLLVKRDEEAKIFCVKRLRNLRALDPRDLVISVVGSMSPATLRRDRVVVAKVLVPRTLKSPEAVRLVVEALVRIDWPETLRLLERERLEEEALEKVSFPV
jgi:hypothetical protein